MSYPYNKRRKRIKKLLKKGIDPFDGKKRKESEHLSQTWTYPPILPYFRPGSMTEG